jgi:hypothetical protein
MRLEPGPVSSHGPMKFPTSPADAVAQPCAESFREQNLINTCRGNGGPGWDGEAGASDERLTIEHRMDGRGT